MIWAWIKHGIKSHPSVFILIATISIAYGYEQIEIPDGKFNHPNPPEKPHSYYWFGKFITIYITGFLGYMQRLLPSAPSTLERDVIASYFLFDFLGMLSYIYQGWPEQSERIIIGFCLSCILLVSLRIWRLSK